MTASLLFKPCSRTVDRILTYYTLDDDTLSSPCVLDGRFHPTCKSASAYKGILQKDFVKMVFDKDNTNTFIITEDLLTVGRVGKDIVIYAKHLPIYQIEKDGPGNYKAKVVGRNKSAYRFYGSIDLAIDNLMNVIRK